ncbi:hypothetical protein JXB12_01220 [candidate division KSB1 bacterium]|nr:hypothetical protein [candidate division KSB1 bacterium]
MNDELITFFIKYYRKGRICLVGANDVIGMLIRSGQAGLTPDKKPSQWSHCFIMGDRRQDGREDGSIYIFESDLHVSTKTWEVLNGVQESRLIKWCGDNVEHACVLGIKLSKKKTNEMIRQALFWSYDDNHLRYAVGELFGTLWAILWGKLRKKNIFDDRYAVQCASFVRMCYQNIGKDILNGPVDLTHTSPEAIHQSKVFNFRKEWHREKKS